MEPIMLKKLQNIGVRLSAEEANYSTLAPCSNAGPMRDLSENTHNHHNNNTNWSSCVYHNHKNNVHHHHHQQQH